MNTILAKFLLTCFVCKLIGFTACIPLKGDKNIQDDISSLIPFSLPNPITAVQKTLSSISTLLIPASQNENSEHATEAQDIKYYEKRAARTVIPRSLSGVKEIENKTTPLDMAIKTNEIKPTIHNNIKNSTPSTKISTDKKDTDATMIDNTLIDPAFQEGKLSNTTEDFTTEMDYESTTTDEDIIRVPAPVLATLLGG